MKTGIVILWAVVVGVSLYIGVQYVVQRSVVGGFSVLYRGALPKQGIHPPVRIALLAEGHLCPDCEGMFDAKCVDASGGATYQAAYWEHSGFIRLVIHCVDEQTDYAYEVAYRGDRLVGDVTAASQSGSEPVTRVDVELHKMANKAL